MSERYRYIQEFSEENSIITEPSKEENEEEEKMFESSSPYDIIKSINKKIFYRLKDLYNKDEAVKTKKDYEVLLLSNREIDIIWKEIRDSFITSKDNREYLEYDLIFYEVYYPDVFSEFLDLKRDCLYNKFKLIYCIFVRIFMDEMMGRIEKFNPRRH